MTNHPNVLVDSREPDWVINGLNNYDKMNPGKKHLEVGDICIGGGAAIERKEINNLISDVVDKSSNRPWSQLRNMQENFEASYVIVHGTRDDIKTFGQSGTQEKQELDNKMKRVRGTGLSIELDWGIPFIWVEDAVSFLDTVWGIFKREKKMKRSSKPYSAVKSTASMKERVGAMLHQIDKIGPSRAEKIMKEKRTLKEIINMSKTELKQLLGNKVGENVYKTFNEEIE